jgi:hypothetical protein
VAARNRKGACPAAVGAGGDDPDSAVAVGSGDVDENVKMSGILSSYKQMFRFIAEKYKDL